MNNMHTPYIAFEDALKDARDTKILLSRLLHCVYKIKNMSLHNISNKNPFSFEVFERGHKPFIVEYDNKTNILMIQYDAKTVKDVDGCNTLLVLLNSLNGEIKADLLCDGVNITAWPFPKYEDLVNEIQNLPEENAELIADTITKIIKMVYSNGLSLRQSECNLINNEKFISITSTPTNDDRIAFSIMLGFDDEIMGDSVSIGIYHECKPSKDFEWENSCDLIIDRAISVDSSKIADLVMSQLSDNERAFLYINNITFKL